MDNSFGMGFDSEYYKDLIKKDEHKDEVIEPEVLPGLGPIMNGLDVLKSMKELSKEKDESAQAELRQMSEVFTKLFDGLNEKYGLSVHYDCESFADSLKSIVDPINMKAMSLYLSEGYQRFRLILYQQFMTTIAMISKQIFDPSYILSESLTFADKMIVIEKLMMFMQQMNEIYKEVKVDQATELLEKLGEKNTDKLSIDDPKIKDLLELIAKKATQDTNEK